MNIGYKKIVFICNKTPNRLTCHSLFRKISGLKEIEEFKVELAGKFINIFINQNDIYELNKEYVFFDKKTRENIVCKLVKVDDLNLFYFENNDFVNIIGTVSYAIKFNNGKKQCPINFKGEFDYRKLNEQNKNTFIKFLNNNIGIDFNSNILLNKTDRLLDYSPFSREFLDESDIEKSKEKLFLNVFSFNFQSTVKNKDVLNKLAIKSIGKDKSYGFGNLSIFKIDDNLKEINNE